MGIVHQHAAGDVEEIQLWHLCPTATKHRAGAVVPAVPSQEGMTDPCHFPPPQNGWGPSALHLDKSWPWKLDISSEKIWVKETHTIPAEEAFSFLTCTYAGKMSVSASRNAVEIMSFKCLSFPLSHACGGSACLRRVNSIFTDLIYIKDVLDCNKLCF